MKYKVCETIAPSPTPGKTICHVCSRKKKKNTFHYNCRIVEFKNSKLDQWKIEEGILRIEETSKCILEM